MYDKNKIYYNININTIQYYVISIKQFNLTTQYIVYTYIYIFIFIYIYIYIYLYLYIYIYIYINKLYIHNLIIYIFKPSFEIFLLVPSVI